MATSSHNEYKEGEMVARCLRGEPGSFEAIHAAHSRRVMAYLLRSGFSVHDAEDLCQDIFVRVVKSLKKFDESRGALGAWIATIARNVARKRWRRKASRWLDFDPELAEETLSGGDDPSGATEAVETIEALDDCIGRLPGELQQMIRLRYVEGRTTRGISSAVGMPEATVRLHLDKARDILRRCLESKGIEA